MTDNNSTLGQLAAGMMPDAAELDRRLRFLDIGPDDLALLRLIHPRLAPGLPRLIDAFYRHLQRVPELRALLGDAAAMARLRRVQLGYFHALTSGDYGAAYVRDRLRVGLVHQRIGLKPIWYIGAYRKYLAELAPLLQQLLADQPELFLQAYGALYKIISFDMSLALDTYIEAGRRQLLGLKNYSEQIISGMPSGVMVIEADRRVRTVNQAMLTMLGCAGAPAAHLGRSDYAVLVADLLLRERIEQALAQPAYQCELAVTLACDTGRRYLSCKLSRTLLDGADLLLLIAEDITVPMQAKAELRESEERFRAAFGQAAVGLAQVAADGRWLRVNRKLLDIVGYSEAELLALRLPDIVSPEDWQIDRDILRALLAGELQTSTREKRYIRKDGQRVWVKATVAAMQAGDGEPSVVAVIEDISQRKQFEQQLLHLASHDPLTGLANRSLLLDRLDQAVAAARRNGRAVAVLFLDLDRFKTINDSLGHDAGDRVIVEVGRRLQRAVREADTVARMGGDEFVVLLPDLPGAGNEAAPLAQKLLDTLFQPMLILGHELAPASSIGISLYPRDGNDGKALLKNADAAMYRAKEQGRGNYLFYSQEMNARTLERLTLESGLRHAVERDELRLVYQPQVELASGELVGVEALLRWQPAGRSLVMPDAFIPIAEETGLIVPIGEWVLRTACAQHMAWRRAGLREVRMAVNLSARQFRQPGLDAMVARVLADTGCGARCLELEITESVLMERPDSAAQTLQALSDMGVQLSIDDFGTGYSSLAYLKRFPIHALKIDRSFVRDIPGDADDAAIAAAVIALAHSMALTVVAEGVETAQQRHFLHAQRCDHAQGYLFSEPLAATALLPLLQQPGPASVQCSCEAPAPEAGGI